MTPHRPKARHWHPSQRVQALLLLLVLAGGIGLSSRLEWVQEEGPSRPRWNQHTHKAQAQLEALLARVGARLVKPKELTKLPPVDVTLVLSRFAPTLPPYDPDSLRTWVEQGGQLVFEGLRPEGVDPREEQEPKPGTFGWVPVTGHLVPRAQVEPPSCPSESSPGAVPCTEPASAPDPRVLLTQDSCLSYVETGAQAPFFADSADRERRWCLPTALEFLQPRGVQPVWAMEREGYPVALRVPVGAGSVAVSAYHEGLAEKLLIDDKSALVVALLQLRPGREVWWIGAEELPSLMAWVWERAATVLVLLGLALVAGCWRAGARFGPLQAATARGRRSMAEQIRGTAAFLARHDPLALWRAQMHALEAEALRRWPAWREADAARRLRWLARSSGLPAAALASAGLHGDPSRGDLSLADAIRILEQARRNLATAALPSHLNDDAKDDHEPAPG